MTRVEERRREVRIPAEAMETLVRSQFDQIVRGVSEARGIDVEQLRSGVDEGPFAKPTPNQILTKLSSLLSRHPEVRHIEFMNEPLNFSNIVPEEYVVARFGGDEFLVLGPHLETVDTIEPYLTLYGLAMAGEHIGGA